MTRGPAPTFLSKTKAVVKAREHDLGVEQSLSHKS